MMMTTTATTMMMNPPPQTMTSHDTSEVEFKVRPELINAIDDFHRDGLAVIDDFLSFEEVEEMRREACAMVEDAEAKLKIKPVRREKAGDPNIAAVRPPLSIE